MVLTVQAQAKRNPNGFPAEAVAGAVED